MTIQYFFPLALLVAIFSSFLFVKFFRSLLFQIGIRRLFSFVYLAVHVHEILHYLAAILCLKWPKYKGVVVTKEGSNLKIKGGVEIKKILYSSLFYNMANGSFVLEIIYLVHELITGFTVGLAPVLVPYLFAFYLLSLSGLQFSLSEITTLYLNLPYWKIALYLPFIFFAALVASPSWADIKQALPLFFLFFLIPVPEELSVFLVVLSALLLGSSLVFLVLKFFVFLLKR